MRTLSENPEAYNVIVLFHSSKSVDFTGGVMRVGLVLSGEHSTGVK